MVKDERIDLIYSSSVESVSFVLNRDQVKSEKSLYPILSIRITSISNPWNPAKII